MRHRRKIIYVGAERSGKTYLMEKRANAENKTGKTCFVYNVGSPKDFPGYTEIEFPTFNEMLSRKHKEERKTFRINPTLEYFRINGDEYDIRRFNAVTKGMKLKSYKLRKTQEKMLFEALADYASGINFMIDDARSVLKNALREDHIYLFSRKNHTGTKSSSPKMRGAGMDISAVFHSLDYVTEEMYIYATHLHLFRVIGEPDLRKIKDRGLIEAVKYAHEQLKKLPRYHSFLIDLKNPEGVKVQHCKP